MMRKAGLPIPSTIILCSLVECGSPLLYSGSEIPRKSLLRSFEKKPLSLGFAGIFKRSGCVCDAGAPLDAIVERKMTLVMSTRVNRPWRNACRGDADHWHMAASKCEISREEVLISREEVFASVPLDRPNQSLTTVPQEFTNYAMKPCTMLSAHCLC